MVHGFRRWVCVYTYCEVKRLVIDVFFLHKRYFISIVSCLFLCTLESDRDVV
jgi:hypothetical protein